MTNRPAKDSRGLSKLPNFGKPGGATSTGYCFEDTVFSPKFWKRREGPIKRSPVLAGREKFRYDSVLLRVEERLGEARTVFERTR